MPDNGVTNWPATDNLNLPADMDTRAPTSAGDGNYTFKQWLERVTGILRAIVTDSRWTDSRTPSGSAGGDLTGTYPNPTIGASKVTSAKVDSSVEITSNKGAASGYMGLDGSSRGAQAPKLHGSDHGLGGTDPATGVGLVGVKQYAPGTDANYTTTGNTLTALDTTNMTVSFVAPPSGKVLLRLSAFAVGTNACLWGVLDHTSHAITGVLMYLGGGGTVSDFCSPAQQITGLTPGTTYQWDWAAASNSAGGNVHTHAQSDTVPANGNYGPAVMEVWASP